MARQHVQYHNLKAKREALRDRLKSDVLSLKSNVDLLIKYGAYIRKNPDNNDAADLIAEFDADVDQIRTVMSNITAKLQDVKDVIDGVMTTDQLIAKRAVDVAVVSNEIN